PEPENALRASQRPIEARLPSSGGVIRFDALVPNWPIWRYFGRHGSGRPTHVRCRRLTGAGPLLTPGCSTRERLYEGCAGSPWALPFQVWNVNCPSVQNLQGGLDGDDRPVRLGELRNHGRRRRASHTPAPPPKSLPG